MADKFQYTLPSLEYIADSYKFTALDYIYNGYPSWTKAPYRTGNLFRQVKDYNTASRMATYRETKSNTKVELPQITVSLNFAPPAASYGKWVEWGNGTGVGGGRPRPFAELAANSKQFKQAVDEVMTGNNGLINAYMSQTAKNLNSILSKIGKTK
jgi:hypothetical protein